MKRILTILFGHPKSFQHTFVTRKLKLFTLISVLILFCGSYAECGAQVIEGDVELTTQAQVDLFVGTSITGNLAIHYDWVENINNIVDLSPLSTLTAVGGDLTIALNDSLVTLNGLGNLTSVGGGLNIDYNKCDFMDAFTRNVVRFLDLVLLFYLISFVMMNRNLRRQRFGDIVAQTVVIKV